MQISSLTPSNTNNYLNGPVEIQSDQKTGFDILDVYEEKNYPSETDKNGLSKYLAGFTEEKMQLDDTQIAVLELLKDYNDAKQKAEEANRLKEAFLANISHEVRTPLNAIMGFSELLSKRDLGEQEKEFVKIIKSAGNNLLTIINDILDISKIEAGMITFTRKKFTIREVYSAVKEQMDHIAKEKQIELIFRCDENVPARIEGDPDRLTQVITNLVGNAIKFTPKGKVVVSVKTIQVHQDKLLLEFSIKDNGIGIPKNKLESIFERFSQVESHSTRKYGGTGLGLSIAKNLVELQGGTISVNSEFKVGSEFSFRLPYYRSASVVVEPTRRDQPFQVKDLRVLNILLVEDNKLNVKLISSLFAENELKVQVSENGAEAIKLLKERTFDIVLMDMEMPVMDGYEATRIIRKELNSVIPIIAITAHAMAGEREKCLRLGMNDYIAKPVNSEILFKKIHDLTINS